MRAFGIVAPVLALGGIPMRARAFKLRSLTFSNRMKMGAVDAWR